MGLDVEKFLRNPKVKEIKRNSIRLTTEFRIELFKLLREDKTEAIKDLLSANSLSDADVCDGYCSRLITALEMNGYPVYQSDEIAQMNDYTEENPLLLSGKFKRRSKGSRGISIDPEFENQLFSMYPDVPVEEGLRLAGIDPVDVGSARVYRINEKLAAKASRLEKAGADNRGKEKVEQESGGNDIGVIARHPYIKDLRDETIVLSEAFYNETYLLTAIPIEEVLEAYGLKSACFSSKDLILIRSQQVHWIPTPVSDTIWTDQVLHIQKNRYYLLSKAVASGFNSIRTLLLRYTRRYMMRE